MILEYILLLTMVVLFVTSVIFTGPNNAFRDAGPKLAARVEKQLISGDKFSRTDTMPSTEWKEK